MEINIHSLTKDVLYMSMRIYGEKLRKSQKYSDIENEELEKLSKIRPIPTKSPHYLVSKKQEDFQSNIKPFSLELLRENKDEIDNLLLIEKTGKEFKLREIEQSIKEELKKEEEVKEEPIVEEENEEPLTEEQREEVAINHLNRINSLFEDDDNEKSQEEEPVIEKENNEEPNEESSEEYYSEVEDTEYEYEYTDDEEYEYEDSVYYYEEDYEEDYEENYEEEEYEQEYEQDYEENYEKEPEVEKQTVEIPSKEKVVKPTNVKVEVETKKEVENNPSNIQELEKKYRKKPKNKPNVSNKDLSPKLKFLMGVKEIQSNTSLTLNNKDRKFMELVEEDIKILLRSRLNMTSKEIIDNYKEVGLDNVANRVLNKLRKENKILTRNGKIRLF